MVGAGILARGEHLHHDGRDLRRIGRRGGIHAHQPEIKTGREASLIHRHRDALGRLAAGDRARRWCRRQPLLAARKRSSRHLKSMVPRPMLFTAKLPGGTTAAARYRRKGQRRPRQPDGLIQRAHRQIHRNHDAGARGRAAMVTVPVYVPVASPLGSATTATVAGDLRRHLARRSRPPSATWPPVAVCAIAENASEPLPVFDTRTICVPVVVGLLRKRERQRGPIDR